MSDRVLVLGATGFAGRHFSRAAKEAGATVIQAARGPGRGDVECDVLDPGSLGRALTETSPSAVVNLTGVSSVAASWQDPRTAFEVNAVGTLNLLRALDEHLPSAHVLCISSGEVYGRADESELPFREDAPLLPLSPYGASKAAMEVICGQFARASGLRIALVRAFTHFGPGQAETFVASSFAKQVAEAELRGDSEVMLRTGNLSPARDFCDVRDMVQAYLLLIERGLTGTFNACSGRPVQIGKLIDHLQASTALTIKTASESDRMRPTEIPVLYGSAEKLREATGWHCSIKLEQTVADMVGWWRDRLAGA